MPNSPTNIIEEMLAAARGMAAVVVGDRRAPSYFDFSLRGLAGSFIAFLAAATLDTYLPSLTGTPENAGISTSGRLLMVALLFAVQLGFSALALRQLNRLDGFVPYMVAGNWATFFVTAISALFDLFGLTGGFAIVVVLLLGLVTEINIARLVVTLRPWQIVLLLVAQAVGLGIGLIVLGAVFPLPPDALPPAA